MENNTVFARSSATNSRSYLNLFGVRERNVDEAQSVKGIASTVT